MTSVGVVIVALFGIIALCGVQIMGQQETIKELNKQLNQNSN